MSRDSSLATSKKSLRRKPPPPLEDISEKVNRPVHFPTAHTELPPRPSQYANTSYQDVDSRQEYDTTMEDSFLMYDSPRPMGPKDLPAEQEYYQNDDLSYFHSIQQYSDHLHSSQPSQIFVQDTEVPNYSHEPYLVTSAQYQDNSAPYQNTPIQYQHTHYQDLLMNHTQQEDTQQYQSNLLHPEYGYQEHQRYLPDSQLLQSPNNRYSPGGSPGHSPLLFGSSSSRKRSIPPRVFQNLLQKSPLYSAQDSLQSPLPPRFHGNRIDTSSVPIPPYPQNDLDFTDEESPISGQLNRDPIFGTPSKIPDLVGDISLKNIDYESPITASADYHSPPAIGIANPFFTPTISPPRSPSRSPTSRRAYVGHTYQSHGESRSPSPKKYGASPKFEHTNDIDPDDLYYYSNDYMDDRTPRWSLLEHEPLEYGDEDPYTPLTGQFDYSILPELPRIQEDRESPNKHITLRSTVSFINKGSDLPYPTLSIRKKNDDLPPVPLDLPLLPFSSSSLVTQHFLALDKVWSLNSIFQWCLKLGGWLHDLFISHLEFRKALIKLLVFHKRDIPLDMIGRNVTHIIEALTTSKALTVVPAPDDAAKKTDMGIVFTPGLDISGVLVDLTECYCHDSDHKMGTHNHSTLKCYSSQCLMNKLIEHELLMKNTNIHNIVLGADWATHWQLTAEDMQFYDRVVSKRQSYIFDLMKSEQLFIQRAECFVDIVGPAFIKAATLLAGSNITILLKKFEDDILIPAKELLSIHRSTLFEPLLKILIAEGKLITDVAQVAQLYYGWSKSAKGALLKYMSTVPMVEDLLRQESLKKWDDHLGTNPKVKALQVNGNMLLLSTFNSRYQHLPLQLSDIQKSFEEHDIEFTELAKAINSIKLLGSKVNEMKVYADNMHSLRRVEKHLSWKTNLFQPNINLSSPQRKFFYRGDLARKGDLKINTNTVHMIVLDNYILITERAKYQRSYTYKVIETPIPVDYLILENREKEGLLTSIALPSVGGPAGATANAEVEDDPTSYPFKIRYAGRGKTQAFTLFAGSENERKKWYACLLQARSNLIRRVQPIAPYNLDLVSNSFFAYELPSRITKLPICSANDPIQLLAKGTLTALKEAGVTGDIYLPNVPRNALVNGKIHSSEVFTYKNTTFHLVGLTSGVYCSDLKNRWKKVVNVINPTKISVLPSLNVVIILANKILRYYPLHLMVDVYYERKETMSSIQLSNDSILFYEIGRHRGIPTLFVAKRKNAGTTNFKVLALETDNDGILSTFSLIKRFYVQAECYGLSIFNTSIAVHAQRGFEILDLQKLAPRTVPELPPAEKKHDVYTRKSGTQGSDAIRKAIAHNSAKPMGMFKLNNNKEFLLVYNEFAIFVNKSGKLSRTSMMRYDFRARAVSFADNNLFLSCDEVIEVWSISDQAKGTNKLLQVVPGKDVNMTDSAHLSFSMANPRVPGLQMTFTMVPKPDKVVKSV